MNTRVNTRWNMVLALVLAVLMTFSISFAQDEDGDSSTDTTDSDTRAQTAEDTDVSAEPTDSPTSEPAGVGEIAKTADKFNVSAVPTQEQAQDLVNAPEGTAQLGLDDAELLRQVGPKAFAEIQQVQKSITPDLFKRSLAIMKVMPPRQTPPGDVLVQVTDDTGNVLTVFTDYSVVAADVQGAVFFEGYIAGESAASLMIVGQDADGNQYAVSNGDVIGLTATNVVFLGSGDHFYFYLYDEDGNFAGLFDGDGNDYDVAADEEGNVYITDAYGNTGEFYADGSYGVYDEEGTVFDEGGLFGEYDGDDEAAFGEDGDSDEEGEESWQDEDTDEESNSEDGEAEASDANTDDTSGDDSSGG